MNIEEIMRPYYEAKESIKREVLTLKDQKQIRREQINLEKNSLNLRLQRLLDNKENEIEKYILSNETQNAYNPNYVSQKRAELENEYLKSENDLREQISQLESEAKELEKNDYSYLYYDKRIPGILETARVQASRLETDLEIKIERKNIEIRMIDLEIKSIRNKYSSWQMDEAMVELQPYYQTRDKMLKDLEELRKLLERVKNESNLLYNDEELNDWLKGNIERIKDEPIIEDPIEEDKNPIEEEEDPIEEDKDPIEEEEDPIEEDKDPIEEEEDPIEEDKDPIEEDPIEEDKDPIEEEDITLDGIIAKVCGEESFNDRQSSKYAASKIKVFNKPQKNNLGFAYKLVSIPRNIIGIIPRAVMKVYGLFISKETKDIFRAMEERANALTDKEVEKLLNEYKGAIAQSKRIPKGFNNAVRPRVNKYVGERVAKINEEIKDSLKRINYSERVIKVLKDKLATEQSPEMITRINEVLQTTYNETSSCIKKLITLQIEGNNLQNGNGLHSFEEELKALDSKLNYMGGRFSKNREYDPQLWSKISGYSHKIEYSLDPKEVVEAYFSREQIYKENTKEKRSIFNLGSKVTVGKLDYRPFVESLDYGNDPFIRDLITSILVISSTASLVNNIKTSIENATQQRLVTERINAEIIANNKRIASNKEIIDTIKSNGETIEKGMVYDIKQTEGAIENLAERGINDKFGWNFGSSAYKTEDLAHHAETANLSIDNANAIMDLSSKYSSGVITQAEYLRSIQALKEQTTGVYESYVRDLHTYIEGYASNHPQFDYSAILSALKHAMSNSKDSAELTDFITELYDKSLSVTDLSSLDLIESTITSPSLVPDILTLGATVTKVSQEEMDSQKEVKPESKKTQEIRSMIEDLRSLKAELTEEEVKEIEDLLRR